jgi:hypothetical protein
MTEKNEFIETDSVTFKYPPFLGTRAIFQNEVLTPVWYDYIDPNYPFTLQELKMVLLAHRENLPSVEMFYNLIKLTSLNPQVKFQTLKKENQEMRYLMINLTKIKFPELKSLLLGLSTMPDCRNPINFAVGKSMEVVSECVYSPFWIDYDFTLDPEIVIHPDVKLSLTYVFTVRVEESEPVIAYQYAIPVNMSIRDEAINVPVEESGRGLTLITSEVRQVAIQPMCCCGKDKKNCRHPYKVTCIGKKREQFVLGMISTRKQFAQFGSYEMFSKLSGVALSVLKDSKVQGLELRSFVRRALKNKDWLYALGVYGEKTQAIVNIAQIVTPETFDTLELYEATNNILRGVHHCPCVLVDTSFKDIRRVTRTTVILAALHEGMIAVRTPTRHPPVVSFAGSANIQEALERFRSYYKIDGFHGEERYVYVKLRSHLFCIVIAPCKIDSLLHVAFGFVAYQWLGPCLMFALLSGRSRFTLHMNEVALSSFEYSYRGDGHLIETMLSTDGPTSAAMCSRSGRSLHESNDIGGTNCTVMMYYDKHYSVRFKERREGTLFNEFWQSYSGIAPNISPDMMFHSSYPSMEWDVGW